MAARRKANASTRETLVRGFWIASGIGLIALALYGRNPSGVSIAIWRRCLVAVGGIFFLYCGSLYCLPSSRQKRAQLNKELDDLETELDSWKPGRNEPYGARSIPSGALQVYGLRFLYT